jgi:anti-sigma factor RsiW
VQPQKRSSSWLATIPEQRDGIAMLIEDSPSLRAYPAQILERSYPAARRHAARQMRLSESEFPEHCPFDIDAVLDLRWLPGRAIK